MATLRIIGSSLLALFLLFIGWGAYALGAFFNFLFLVLLVTVPFRCLLAFWRGTRDALRPPWRKNENRAERRLLLAQWANRSLFWTLSLAIVELCMAPAEFSASEFREVRLMLWGAFAAQMILELFPGNRVSIPLNAALAVASIFMTVQITRAFNEPPTSNAVELDPPFAGEWVVIQGGASSLINHHYPLPSQRYALDLLALTNGHTQLGSSNGLSSFASWNRPIQAPCSGIVRKVVDELPDNELGQTDTTNLAGNYIVIEKAPGVFVLLAHLQKGSITVTEGVSVQSGQAIARCGNSGNTTEPHLHFQAQDKPEFAEDDVQTFPIHFSNATVRRGGRPLASGKALRRNDRLQRREQP